MEGIKSLETLLENVRRLLCVYAGNICKRQIIFPPSQVLGSLSVVYIKDGLCLYMPDRALINHLVQCKRMEEKNGGYWKVDVITPDISFAVNHCVCVTPFVVVVASVFDVSILSGLFRKKR